VPVVLGGFVVRKRGDEIRGVIEGERHGSENPALGEMLLE